MGAGEPTGRGVWEHHPDLRAYLAASDQMVASRRGRIVLVAGGRASGRTGLARALTARLEGHPARPVVVAGGFGAEGDWQPWPPPDPARLVVPLHAGVELAARVLQLSGTLGAPGAGAVGTLLGQLAGTSQATWALLGRHAERKQPLDDQGGPEALRVALRAAARERPVVCVLDDLDHAPAAAGWWSGLLVRLAGELGDLPLLVVATLEGAAVLGSHELGEPTGLWAARRLVDAGVGIWRPIGRLDTAAVAAWLDPCEPGLAERLWEVTGGEPRWLGQLWDTWRADGTVHRDLASGRWVLGVVNHSGLGTVHDLLWERLARCYGGLVDDDTLDRVVRTLAVGALEGRQFTAQAVAQAVGRDADELIDELDGRLLASQERPDGLLEEARFLELADPRATPNGEGRAVARYRFVSELHWRTLRQFGLPGREHRDGCRALAAALEQVLQPEPERAAATIASLLREAGDQRAAARWRTLAELGTTVPMVEVRARWLLVKDTTGWDQFEHAQATRQLAHATQLLWQHRPADVVLEVAEGWVRAADGARWPSQHAHALNRCGVLHSVRGDLDAAVGCFRRARRVAVAAGELVRAATVMADHAAVELEQGRVRAARRRAEAARQLAQRQHAPAAEAKALFALARVALRVGDHAGARAAAGVGIPLAERAGDRWLLTSLLQELSDAQWRLGQLEMARETAERAGDEARQAGNREGEGWVEMRLGVLWEGVDPQAAERHLLRGVAIASQLDHRVLEVECRIALARLARNRGDLRASRAELLAAARLARFVVDPTQDAKVWQGWALLADAQGVPAGQAAALWALAAHHTDQSGTVDAAASWWQKAERTLAEAGEPGGRAAAAARATSALAQDSGWRLLEEVFGPLDSDGADSAEAGQRRSPA